MTNTFDRLPQILWEAARGKLPDDVLDQMADDKDAPRAAPRVKPLVWEYNDRQSFYTYVVKVLGAREYWINQEFGSDQFYFSTTRRDGLCLYDGDDLPAAKAAAQADYTARILAALDIGEAE